MTAARNETRIKMAIESKLGLGVGIAFTLVGVMLLIMTLVEQHIAGDIAERGVAIEVGVEQKDVSERYNNEGSDSWWVFVLPTRELTAEEGALWDRAVVESQAPNARGLRPDWGDVIAVHLGIKDDPAYAEGTIHTLLVAGDRWRFDVPPFEATWPGVGGLVLGIGMIVMAVQMHRARKDRIARLRERAAPST